jgi:hypothetical protein
VNQKYKTNSIGRPTNLSNTVEELIVHALIKLGDWGFGFTDSYTNGKVLNEETVKAIIQDKNEKKKEALATKTLKAQNNATKAEQKVIKAMEMAEKAKLRVQNLASQLSPGTSNSSKMIVKKKTDCNKENSLICKECELNHQDSAFKAKWLSCENCVNWFCETCKDEALSDDFVCKYC